MTHRQRLLTAVTALFLCAACGADHMQSGDVTALGFGIDSARLEVSRHQDAITSALSLTEIPPEVSRHDHDMGDIMNAMDMRMGGMMSHCSGYGMGAMHEGMNAINFEMQTDHDAMLSEPTLQDARNACSVHTSRMGGILDGMQQSLMTVGCMGR